MYPPDAVVADDGLGYRLGFDDDDGVWYTWEPWETSTRSAELTIRSGDDVFVQSSSDGGWQFDLPFELDEAWALQILFRDEQGVVIGGRAEAFRPGPATAG